MAATAAPARAGPRTDVAPYLEVDQIFIANLKGGGDDVLTYTTLAAGVDAHIATRTVEGQASVRYEHRFGWSRNTSDGDAISGIARGRVNIIANRLSIEAGALATRFRTDGLGGGNGALTANIGQVSQLYSLYAGPTLTTHVGDVGVNAAYRLGYTQVDDDNGTSLPNGARIRDQFGHSIYQSASASVGQQPGGYLPVGWSVGGGWNREDQSVLDARFDDKWVRGDLTVPVSGHSALVGGVGYEDIEVSQRDALRDANGDPVVRDGKLVTDKSSPRRLSYDQDGLIWDVGVLWRPSRRTSLEARIGRRYGSMTYRGSFSWQPDSRSSLNIDVYDSIGGFGRLVTDNLATLSPGGFDVNRNPFSGDPGACVQGRPGQSGKGGGNGICLNPVLTAITGASFRYRGVNVQYGRTAGPWSYGVGLGYTRRRFIAPDDPVFAGLDGARDQIWFADLFLARRIDEKSGFDANIYWNYFDSGLSGTVDTMNAGAYASYYRTIARRLNARASLGLDAVDPKGLESTIAALAQLGLRYQF